MAAGKTKYLVLAADGSGKIPPLLAEILPKTEYEVLPASATAGQIRRLIPDRRVDLLVINAPLKDEFGTQLAQDLANRNLGVLLLTPADVFDQVCCRVESSGVMTLAKPISRQTLYMALRAVTALRAKLLQMEQKTLTLQRKMEDVRTVNHAKWLLMENDHMSEQDAHRYIEKQSMDMRLTRREVAESIIRSFGC